MNEETREQKYLDKLSECGKIWADVYESLIADGVVFPKGLDGVGIVYKTYTIINQAIQTERERLMEKINKCGKYKFESITENTIYINKAELLNLINNK
jgi:hypothetical protein